jgi:hypothetical protein
LRLLQKELTADDASMGCCDYFPLCAELKPFSLKRSMAATNGHDEDGEVINEEVFRAQ